MTLVTMTNGAVLMQDGKVATGSLCCCCALNGVDLNWNTPVQVQMDFGCTDGGGFTANGTWGDLGNVSGINGLVDDCGQGNGAPSSTIEIMLECCPAECVAASNCIKISFLAYVAYGPFATDDPFSGAAFVIGSVCTYAITINENGTFSGTVAIPCDVLGLPGQADTTTVTVSFG